jgi:type III secretion protein U
MMRNVDLARALYAEVEMDDYVPRELFEAIAQVLIWARNVRAVTDGDDAPPPPEIAVPVLLSRVSLGD